MPLYHYWQKTVPWVQRSWLTLLAATSIFVAVFVLLLAVAMHQLPTWRKNLSPSQQHFQTVIAPRVLNLPEANWQTSPPPRYQKTTATKLMPQSGKKTLEALGLKPKADPALAFGQVDTSQIKSPAKPRWQTNTSKQPVPEGWSTIAIVIDDMGVAAELSKAMLEAMPKEVTFAFLPYGRATRNHAEIARMKGHSIMIHIPMQPTPRKREDGTYSAGPNPGPNALLRSDTAAQLQAKLAKNINKLKDLAVGVNNHMGSYVTSSEPHMRAILSILEKENLFFLDSVTTPHPVMRNIRGDYPSLPLYERDFFIDHYIDEEKIAYYLQKTEERALKRGHAIAIGHPHPSTRRALLKWIPTLAEKKIMLIGM